MASVIYLDTHVVAWLYGSGAQALSSEAAELIARSADIRISPMARLELQCLFEIGRLGEPAAPLVDALGASLGLTMCDAAFEAVADEAEKLDWTRDPFDRLIVAQAKLQGAPPRDEGPHASCELSRRRLVGDAVSRLPRRPR